MTGKKEKVSIPKDLEQSKKWLAITEEGKLVWRGFESIYELVGFIDLCVNPQALKRSILEKGK